jgi:hypothetical protein
MSEASQSENLSDSFAQAMKDIADAAKRAYLIGKKLGHEVDTKTTVKLGALTRKGRKKS